MQAMVYQNLILLTIILSHLSIYCDASLPICSRNGMDGNLFVRACSPPRLTEGMICNMRVTLCRLRNTQYSGFIDCMRPQFKCFGSMRCIPSTLHCNGVKDCRDGSDEWGCDSSSMDSTILNQKYLESKGNITLYIKTAMSKLFGVTTTNKTDIKSEDNTSSPPPTPTTLLSQSASNDGFQSSATRAKTMIRGSDSDTALPLSTTGNVNSTNTMDSESEDNTSSPPTIISTLLSQSESNDGFQSSPTRLSAVIPDTDSNTALSLSTTTNENSTNKTDLESEDNTSSTPTIISTLNSQSESNDGFLSSPRLSAMIQDSDSVSALSLSTTEGTVKSRSELNSAPSSSLTTNTKAPFSRDASMIIPEFKDDTPFLETSTVYPEASTIQLCPDDYCMQNAECIVVQGQYRCNCPSSFIGELCEIQLDNEEAFHEYATEMAISITLAILCLAVVLMCIYRIKRTSFWKFRDGSSKTLSQSTLTSNAVE